MEDFTEKKRKHNMKLKIKKNNQVDEIDESAADCYYFYQASTGENLFLDPLCNKIIQTDYFRNDIQANNTEYNNFLELPLQIEGEILEITNHIADPYDHKNFGKQPYLNHIPNGANYGFVEIDLSQLVTSYVQRDFEREISYRDK